jgi:DNA repair protein RadC
MLMAKTFTLKEVAPDDRPRERLLSHGTAALSNSDLVAILLNTGTTAETVTVLAQRLLAEHGGLLGLMKLDAVELSGIRGLGPAKAAKLKAALEIASRIAAMGPEERPRISAPDDVINLVGLEMSVLDQEQLRVVMLDTKNRVLPI